MESFLPGWESILGSLKGLHIQPLCIQEPQRNCTFRNLASVVLGLSTLRYMQYTIVQQYEQYGRVLHKGSLVLQDFRSSHAVLLWCKEAAQKRSILFLSHSFYLPDNIYPRRSVGLKNSDRFSKNVALLGAPFLCHRRQ